MTSEEIKRTVFMEELVERYGLYPNRAGFIVCPFHKGDRNASLKIYKDSFYCFGCGAAGDVFDFVRKMDGMSFKEAFLFLGGEYECKKKALRPKQGWPFISPRKLRKNAGFGSKRGGKRFSTTLT